MYVNGRRQDIDELLARMEAVRGRLDEDAQAAKHTVQELTDWRHVVRQNPFLAVSVAAAAGFLLVPKKPHTTIFSKADIEQLSKENKVIIAKETTASSGIAGTIAALTGAALTRAASNFVAAKMSEFTSQGNLETTQS
jgi:hypothetical protein